MPVFAPAQVTNYQLCGPERGKEPSNNTASIRFSGRAIVLGRQPMMSSDTSDNALPQPRFLILTARAAH
jgi:hypothetical protein